MSKHFRRRGSSSLPVRTLSMGLVAPPPLLAFSLSPRPSHAPTQTASRSRRGIAREDDEYYPRFSSFARFRTGWAINAVYREKVTNLAEVFEFCGISNRVDHGVSVVSFIFPFSRWERTEQRAVVASLRFLLRDREEKDWDKFRVKFGTYFSQTYALPKSRICL